MMFSIRTHTCGVYETTNCTLCVCFVRSRCFGCNVGAAQGGRLKHSRKSIQSENIERNNNENRHHRDVHLVATTLNGVCFCLCQRARARYIQRFFGLPCAILGQDDDNEMRHTIEWVPGRWCVCIPGLADSPPPPILYVFLCNCFRGFLSPSF